MDRCGEQRERREGAAPDSRSGRRWPLRGDDRTGVWDALPAIISQSCPAHRYAVITDSGVAPTYAARLVHALRASAQQAEAFAFPAGEASKTREHWASITDAMLLAGYGRDTAVS